MVRTIEVVVALTQEVREQIKARGLAEVNKVRAVLGKPLLKELLKGKPHTIYDPIASSIISGAFGMFIVTCESRLIRGDGKQIISDEGRHVLEFRKGDDALTCAKKVAKALGTETIRLEGDVYVAMSPDLCILADIFNARLIPELIRET